MYLKLAAVTLTDFIVIFIVNFERIKNINRLVNLDKCMPQPRKLVKALNTILFIMLADVRTSIFVTSKNLQLYLLLS